MHDGATISQNKMNESLITEKRILQIRDMGVVPCFSLIFVNWGENMADCWMIKAAERQKLEGTEELSGSHTEVFKAERSIQSRTIFSCLPNTHTVIQPHRLPLQERERQYQSLQRALPRSQATLLLADEWTLVTFRSPCVDQYDSYYFKRLPEGKESPFANDDSQECPPSPCA